VNPGESAEPGRAVSGSGGLDAADVQCLLDAPVRRIQPTDTNKFVVLVDPLRHGVGFVQVLEIFDVGGRTPPNVHEHADETFVVLHGHGEAHCGSRVVGLSPGSLLLVRAGTLHVIVNTGPTRLYCLTTMVPDEGFAELIRRGTPDRLDAADLEALGASPG
jgi:mannose-6-phosphate isomerase-like protein (cupin superfamily)